MKNQGEYMQQIKIAHYKRIDRTMYRNGGRLLLDDTTLVLKNWFRKIAVFDKVALTLKVLPKHIMGYRAIILSDTDKAYECLLWGQEYAALEAQLLNR